MIAILIPTWGRPDRLADVARNVDQNTGVAHRTLFIVEPDDEASIESCRDGQLDFLLNQHTANYAGAILTGYRNSVEPYVFAAADDLRFHPGWATTCLAHMDGQTKVVGTNDLLNPYVLQGTHATHYLVDRTYLDTVGGVIDQGPHTFLNCDVDHNFTDTEFIGTAKARCVFRPCLDSLVEHIHHAAGKAVHDATYARGDRRAAEDEALYESRKHLWLNLTR